MDNTIIQHKSASPERESWSLIILAKNPGFIRGIQEIFRNNNKYHIIYIFSSINELYSSLEQVKPDFLLISHPEQIEIAFLIKKLYPTLFVILWDAQSGGDAYCSSSLPLLQQLEKITRQKSLGHLTFTIRGQDIYYELVKKTFISPQEKRILHYLSYGYSYMEIAEFLSISPNTLKIYMADLREKLNAKDKTHLLAIAFRSGLVV